MRTVGGKRRGGRFGATATCLAVTVLSTSPASAQLLLKGADTLADVTKEAIAAAGLSAAINTPVEALARARAP